MRQHNVGALVSEKGLESGAARNEMHTRMALTDVLLERGRQGVSRHRSDIDFGSGGRRRTADRPKPRQGQGAAFVPSRHRGCVHIEVASKSDSKAVVCCWPAAFG